MVAEVPLDISYLVEALRGVLQLQVRLGVLIGHAHCPLAILIHDHLHHSMDERLQMEDG